MSQGRDGELLRGACCAQRAAEPQCPDRPGRGDLLKRRGQLVALSFSSRPLGTLLMDARLHPLAGLALDTGVALNRDDKPTLGGQLPLSALELRAQRRDLRIGQQSGALKLGVGNEPPAIADHGPQCPALTPALKRLDRHPAHRGRLIQGIRPHSSVLRSLARYSLPGRTPGAAHDPGRGGPLLG